MASQTSNKTPKIVGVFLISAVMMIGVYTLLIKKSDTNSSLSTQTTSQSETTASTPATAPAATVAPTTTPTPTTTPATTPTTPTPEPQTTSSGYKDGAYEATASYNVPGESNTITASIVIKDGVIESVKTTNEYGDRESTRYINGFQGAISGAIVGKKIDSATVSRVGGASLTSSGFNSALRQIITQAKI